MFRRIRIRTGVLVVITMYLAVSFQTSSERREERGFTKFPPCTNTDLAQLKTMPVENILREGQNVFGDTGKTSPFFPCWMDVDLVRAGQKFARDNYGAVSLAHMLGIISLLGNEQSRRILYSTRRSNTPEKSLKRYTATALHVYIWYTMDIFSATWLKSVRNIRRIHQGVNAYMGSLGNGTRVNKADPPEYIPDENLWKAFELDLENSRYGRMMKNQSRTNASKHAPKYLYNQYLMALTQWAFVGLPILFPEQVTIPRWTDKELQGFAHLWAVISYILGMDERFILCRDPRDLPSCKKYLRDMLDMYLIPSLFNMDTEAKALVESLLSTVKFFIPSSRLEYMLIHFLEDILDVPANHLYKRSLIQTRIARWGMKYFWRPIFHFPIMQRILNFVIGGQRQLASMISFEDPGTNLTAVAEGMYYLEK